MGYGSLLFGYITIPPVRCLFVEQQTGGIRRFSLDIAHRIAEILLQHLDIAANPCSLDGVADGALDAGGAVSDFPVASPCSPHLAFTPGSRYNTDKNTQGGFP